ncbi:inactive CPSFs Cft2p metallobeta-lactamase [Cryptosporidium canis]|nr:inactive CPSFs Cft2p metallobeta-lactamase [Cryptosporidium canis]
MIHFSIKPICGGVIKGNALRINSCLIWFDFGIENESDFDRSILQDLELPHLILLTNFTKTSIGGLPILHRALSEKGISCKIPVICTEPIFRFGNNILSDMIQSMSIKDQDRGVQYTCDKEENKGFKQLPFTNEDIEGILGENVCRLRYYQSFSIQLLHSDDNDANRQESMNSSLTSINLKALPSGLELGSTIWMMTINSNSGSWEFAYVADSASHPYWHVTPSDLGRLNKPDLLMLGVNYKTMTVSNNGSDFGNGLRKFNNRLTSIKKFLSTILDCIKKKKTGTILIPVQLDSLLLEIICYLDAIWNKGKIMYPIFVTSPLIKSFILSVKTLIEWMSLEIRSEFCDTRFNPFHDLKNIILETNLKTIRSENLSKVPKIIFAFPESMDYGYSRELFTELATNENNTILFIREPKENTFAHYIWNEELKLRRSDDQSYIHSLINTDNHNIHIPTNILVNNHELSYSIELPMIRFTPYRQDELYAMYLSHKELNTTGNLNSSSEDIKKNNLTNMSSNNDHIMAESGDLNRNDVDMIKVEDNLSEASFRAAGGDGAAVSINANGIYNDKMDDGHELDNTSSSYCMQLASNDNNSSEKCIKIDDVNNLNSCLSYVNDQNLNSSIQTKIESLRSRLVPVNVDDELLNLNPVESSSLNCNDPKQNLKAKKIKDDYGCLLDNETIQSIIDSWKDASSDLDISAYNLKPNVDGDSHFDKSSKLNSGDSSAILGFGSSNDNSSGNGSIHILAPRRRRNTGGQANLNGDNALEIDERDVTLESDGNSGRILNRNIKAGGRLPNTSSIDSHVIVQTSSIPEWRIHFRQMLGGSEPFRISHEMSKIEVRLRAILTDGLELKSELPYLLPLLNCSSPKTVVLLSDINGQGEECALKYYKSLLMSIPNYPKSIVASKANDKNLIEFTFDESVKAVSFDNSVWDDVSTGGFQLVQNGSAPSAALQDSSKRNGDSISSYYAFAKIDNISAKMDKNGEIFFVKNSKLKIDSVGNDDQMKPAAVNDSLADNSTSNHNQSPYSALNCLIKKVIKREHQQTNKKAHHEILLSKSRGIRHIVSEMRKQNPLPIINISPNGGIVSVNNAIAFSSNNLNRDFKISQINDDCQNNSSLKVKKGDHITSNSSIDDINIWNLHATLHPYYYIARGILRNQFAIL